MTKTFWLTFLLDTACMKGCVDGSKLVGRWKKVGYRWTVAGRICTSLMQPGPLRADVDGATLQPPPPVPRTASEHEHRRNISCTETRTLSTATHCSTAAERWSTYKSSQRPHTSDKENMVWIQSEYPDPDSGSGLLPKFNRDFLLQLQGCICDKIFIKIWSFYPQI